MKTLILLLFPLTLFAQLPGDQKINILVSTKDCPAKYNKIKELERYITTKNVSINGCSIYAKQISEYIYTCHPSPSQLDTLTLCLGEAYMIGGLLSYDMDDYEASKYYLASAYKLKREPCALGILGNIETINGNFYSGCSLLRAALDLGCEEALEVLTKVNECK